jgi:hypothetical protein
MGGLLQLYRYRHPYCRTALRHKRAPSPPLQLLATKFSDTSETRALCRARHAKHNTAGAWRAAGTHRMLARYPPRVLHALSSMPKVRACRRYAWLPAPHKTAAAHSAGSPVTTHLPGTCETHQADLVADTVKEGPPHRTRALMNQFIRGGTDFRVTAGMS